MSGRLAALGRRVARFLAYDRHGASRTKKSLSGWSTSTGGPDSDITHNLPLLRERSRDLYMGDGLAAGALRTIRTNEIGAGLRLNAQIDRAVLGLTDEQALAWEDAVEREFALWADSPACDAERRCNFGQLQALARLSQLMSGDVFALLLFVERPGDRYGIKVRLVEGDRICNPDMVPAGADVSGGVEVDALGAPVAYWVRNTHPGDTIDLGGMLSPLPRDRWQRVPAWGAETGRPLVLHLMDMERPGQRRGVPLLAPVIADLKQLSRYTDAELTAAIVSGMFAAFIETEAAAPASLPQLLPANERTADTQAGAAREDTLRELAPGMIAALNPGESVSTANPGRPNTAFEAFFVAISKKIGAGIGLPYELVLKQFTASYSASRAALLEAWKVFAVGRANMVSSFCRPIFEEWLAEAVARGRIAAPGFFDDALVRGAWSRAEWIGPTQGQLDPVKEVTAAQLRVDAGFSTRARETRELTGGDWYEYHAAREREEAMRRAAGLAADPNAAPATSTTAADPNAEPATSEAA